MGPHEGADRLVERRLSRRCAEIAQRTRLLAHLGANSPARARELRDAGVAATTISRAVDAGLVLRIGRGLYQLPDNTAGTHSALIEVSKRAPRAVICLTSALAFHEVTDLLPHRIWIAIGIRDWVPKIEYPPIRVVRFREPFLSNGVDTHAVGRTELRVYSITKTIADAFRLPRLVDRSAAIVALKTALRERKATPGELAAAASKNGAWRQMQPYLEALTVDG